MKINITKSELEAKGGKVAPEHEQNFMNFWSRVNIFREQCGIPMIVSSYYRTREDQIRIYKKKAEMKQFPFENGIYDEKKVPFGSNHMLGLACDFSGSTVQRLKAWILENISWCKDFGFYFEDFDATPTWLHI